MKEKKKKRLRQDVRIDEGQHSLAITKMRSDYSKDLVFWSQYIFENMIVLTRGPTIDRVFIDSVASILLKITDSILNLSLLSFTYSSSKRMQPSSWEPTNFQFYGNVSKWMPQKQNWSSWQKHKFIDRC